MANDPLPAWERFRLYCDPSWRFEPGPHLGYLNGKILWSVTGALKQAGLIKGDYYRPEHLVRGSQVHAACHYHDEGDLNRLALVDHPYHILGYVDAWAAFCRDFKFVPQCIELPMYDPVYLFSTIPDRIGLLDGEPAIVEIKSGAVMRWVGYQTAGQDIVVQAWDEKPVVRRRLGVPVRVDGTYGPPVPFEDDYDYDVMKAALIVAQAAGGIDRGAPPVELLVQ